VRALKTLSDMQNYRQQMLEGLAKHGCLSYRWDEGSGHDLVANQLCADGLIQEIPDGWTGRRSFKYVKSS
jgi:hypothetical protein